MDNYIEEERTFKPKAIRALRELKSKKTFRKPQAKRLQAFTALIRKLAKVYEVEAPVRVTTANLDGGDSGRSHVWPPNHEMNPNPHWMIVLEGKLSIITLLHEFAHIIRGSDEVECRKWSMNLFRKVYPKQFARLNIVNGMAYKSEEAIRNEHCACGGELKYEADIASPGRGQSWKCIACDKPYWKLGGNFTPFDEVNPSDVEMDPSNAA